MNSWQSCSRERLPQSLFRHVAVIWLCCCSAGLLADDPNTLALQGDTVVGNADGTTRISGNVSLTMAQIFIEADEMLLEYADNETIETVTATGNVDQALRLRRESTDDSESFRASATKLIYQVKTQKLKLSGDVRVEFESQTLEADQLNYDISTGAMKAKGDPDTKRVRIEVSIANDG